jgi:hypothetical protein
LKAWGHLTVAVFLTLASVFFTWIWFISGNTNCIPTALGVGGCSFNPSDGNMSFVSVAALCIFLAGTESTIALKSMGNRNLVEAPSQSRYRKRGIVFITIGTVLSFIGFYLFNTTMVYCPANGCSNAEMLAIYGPLLGLLYIGMILVALGDVFILKTKFMKAPTESPSARTQAST